ncbi:hypothetical protein COCCADRAFT_113220, partial [Bipolaris zeicola 26-R-13]
LPALVWDRLPLFMLLSRLTAINLKRDLTGSKSPDPIIVLADRCVVYRCTW